MSEIAEKFGIKQALKDLGIEDINNGTSTGKISSPAGRS
jgi:aldehyde dehydrogenase (NAD+)